MDVYIKLSSALVILALILFLCALYRRYLSPLRSIPGPFLASFSKGWQLWHAVKGDTEKALLELHKRHEVSCSHPDAVRAILLAPLTKGDWYKACAIPDRTHQTAMSETDPKRKSEMKKIFAPGYLSSNVLRSEAHLDYCLEGLQAHLGRLADSRTPAHLEDWFHYWSFDSVAGLVFSGSFGFLEKAKDIGGSIANARSFMLYLSVTAHANWIHDVLLGNPILQWLGFKPKQHIMDTTTFAAEKRRRDPEAGQDMIEQWGLALRKVELEGFKEEDLIQNAASTITAGSDTTATALQSFIYHSMRYPLKYKNVLTEIETASGEGRLSPTVQASEVMDLSYLQATLKEVLRFFPPVPSGFPRKAPAGGLVIGSRQFPAGTTLSVNPYIIHFNPECFGPSAEEFLPERWLSEDAKSAERFFIPFGLGYNSCPGRPIAFIQLSKAAAQLMRDFEFEQVETGKEWKYKNRFTVVPHDWPCLIKRRKTSLHVKTTEVH